jgi:hypothetical protein
MADTQKVKSVYLFDNGMVMVFDEQGHQIPELQGPEEEVSASIRQRMDPDRTEVYGFFGAGPINWNELGMKLVSECFRMRKHIRMLADLLREYERVTGIPNPTAQEEIPTVMHNQEYKSKRIMARFPLGAEIWDGDKICIVEEVTQQGQTWVYDLMDKDTREFHRNVSEAEILRKFEERNKPKKRVETAEKVNLGQETTLRYGVDVKINYDTPTIMNLPGEKHWIAVHKDGREEVLDCECMGWTPTYPVFRSTIHHPNCPKFKKET